MRTARRTWENNHNFLIFTLLLAFLRRNHQHKGHYETQVLLRVEYFHKLYLKFTLSLSCIFFYVKFSWTNRKLLPKMAVRKLMKKCDSPSRYVFRTNGGAARPLFVKIDPVSPLNFRCPLKIIVAGPRRTPWSLNGMICLLIWAKDHLRNSDKNWI